MSSYSDEAATSRCAVFMPSLSSHSRSRLLCPESEIQKPVSTKHHHGPAVSMLVEGWHIYYMSAGHQLQAGEVDCFHEQPARDKILLILFSSFACGLFSHSSTCSCDWLSFRIMQREQGRTTMHQQPGTLKASMEIGFPSQHSMSIVHSCPCLCYGCISSSASRRG